MADVVLHQGDCMEILPTLAAGSVDVIVTDPPYGVGYSHGGQSTGGRSSHQVKWDAIEGDGRPDGRWLFEAYRILGDGGALYIMTRWDVEPEWRAFLVDVGFRVCQRLTWHKRVNGKGDLQGTYGPTCEDVLFASKGRHRLNHRPSMLLDVGCVPTWERRYHPHQKPVALSKLLILASTRPGDVVLDPFAGSGTTGVACMKAGRKCILIEKDEKYIPIIERRLREAETPLFAGLSED